MGGDDFACDAESLKGCEQWEGSFGKETYLQHSKVFSKCDLQLLMEMTIIGNPLGVPYLLKHLVELIEIG